MWHRILGPLAVLGAFFCTVTKADDLVTLRANVVARLTAAVPEPAVIEKELALLRPDGTFSDVDYADRTNSSFLAFKHVNRLHDLAVAWAAGPDDAALRAAVLRAYSAWIARDVRHPNWWFNEIGVPDALSETMLLLQARGVLPADDFAHAIRILARAGLSQPHLTAANLVWTSYATRNQGLLQALDPAASVDDKAAAVALVKTSFDKIGSTVQRTTSEGINADYSFHAHGPMLYNGGYGQAWLVNTAAIAADAVGTGYGLTGDRVRTVIDYLLEGDQFMTRGVTYDRVTTGRNWSRTKQSELALDLIDTVGRLIRLAPDYRHAELTALRARLNAAKKTGVADPANTAVGNRGYWTADYMVQQRPAYLLSVKTNSTRTGLPEAINGENLRGGYGYDGVNLIYRTGNEYKDIEPAWDWYRLPGVTSERAADGVGGTYPLLVNGGRGATPLAGGASDGRVGATAYAFDHFGVRAHKAWFLFDRGEVALGSGITQAKPLAAGGVVGTTVNQTRLDGPVVYSTAAGRPTTLGPEQSVTPTGLRWVHHDAVGYFFMTPADHATIRTVTQSGTWQALNRGDYPHEPVRLAVFGLDLSHGSTPTDAAYAYAVVPGIAAADMDAALAAGPFTVLCNDAAVQAVTDQAAGVTGAAFYAAGTVTLSSGRTLTLTTPGHAAVVLLRQDGGRWTLSAASPEAYAGPLTFSIGGHLTGNGTAYDPASRVTTLTVTLPGGPMAGSTATATFEDTP